VCVCVCVSHAFFSQFVFFSVDKLGSYNNKIFGSKLKDWTRAVEHALPHRGFHVIKVHDSLPDILCSS